MISHSKSAKTQRKPTQWHTTSRDFERRPDGSGVLASGSWDRTVVLMKQEPARESHSGSIWSIEKGVVPCKRGRIFVPRRNLDCLIPFRCTTFKTAPNLCEPFY